MQVFKFIHQLVAFLLELVMLAAFGYWSYKMNRTPMLKWIAGIGVPLLGMILWGIFAAPKSAYRLPLSYQILFSLSLFSMAGYMLYQTGHKTMAALFMSTAIASSLVAYFTER